MLKINDLHVYYGAIHALKGINLEVHEGEIVTLIGANGAGKTTTLHTISGLIRPKEGNIVFEGNDITKMAPQKIVARGLSQVPEGRRVFANLSVRKNLELGAYLEKNRKVVSHHMEQVFQSFPRLKEREKQTAGTLSGGEQQMLAMGRALMNRPKLMVLDEPSMGLAPLLVKDIFAIIKRINEEGTTILLVEQNASMALSIASRAYVLETGKVVLSGPSAELAKSEAIKKAYLGG